MAHTSLRDHPKLSRLVAELGQCEPTCVGHLVFLWWAANGQTSIREDGILVGWSVDHIAKCANWPHEPSEFVGALLAAGFLDHVGEELAIHDYSQWCPDFVKRRWKREATSDTDRSLTGRRSTSVSTTRPDPTQPNPKQPDPTRPDHTEPYKSVPNRTGPATGFAAQEEFTESDRQEADQFRQLFAAKILQAIGCDDTKKQKVPLYAVANRIMHFSDRNDIANQMIEIAKGKRGKGLKNPIAAWQKEIDGRWPPTGSEGT